MSNHTEQVIDEIKAERVRQQSAEGWTEEHDDEHGDGSLATAAQSYIASAVAWMANRVPTGALWSWPWEARWFKPKDARRDLIRASALIVAEIERLDRKAKEEQAKERGA